MLFFNNFPAEPTAGPDCLVRSLDLVYSDQQAPADPCSPSLHVPGLGDADRLRRAAAGGSGRPGPMPPLEFSYSQPRIQPDILTLDPDSLANLPEGLDRRPASGGPTSTARACPGS